MIKGPGVARGDTRADEWRRLGKMKGNKKRDRS